jgi:hypothetical protein
MKAIGLVVIVLGVLGLVYGGFTYTKKTDKASIGPIQIAVKDQEHVNIPLWAGVGAIVIGAGLIAVGGKNS